MITVLLHYHPGNNDHFHRESRIITVHSGTLLRDLAVMHFAAEAEILEYTP